MLPPLRLNVRVRQARREHISISDEMLPPLRQLYCCLPHRSTGISISDEILTPLRQKSRCRPNWKLSHFNLRWDTYPFATLETGGNNSLGFHFNLRWDTYPFATRREENIKMFNLYFNLRWDTYPFATKLIMPPLPQEILISISDEILTPLRPSRKTRLSRR